MVERARVTFAVGDIHGRLDLLRQAFDWIEARAVSYPVINVVFIGDYIDRGPESRGVVDRMLEGLKRPDDRLVCLMGNHEEMALRALGGRPDLWDFWMKNGGEQTLASYGGTIDDRHVEWMGSLPLSFSDHHRFYVHAGVNPRRSLAEQTAYDRLWIRDRFLDAVGPFEKHIVHGHTPRDHRPELLPHRTNLDVGAVWTNRLVVAIFDDEIPSGPVHVETLFAGSIA